jgi:transketolase
MINLVQMRDFFIDNLRNAAKKDKNILLISNEQGASALDKFRKELDNQFINAGISEQNIISVSAGLASQGKKVFVYSISSFITLRCFEQIKIDLNIMKLPVTILAVGASYSYDTSGPTHHSIDDIAILRTLGNFEIYSPSDNNVLKKIFNETLKSKIPNIVRLDRFPLKNIGECKEVDIKRGFRVFGKSKKIAIISTGITTQIISNLREELSSEKIEFLNIDIFQIKNFNKRIFKTFLSEVKNVITVEEHTLNGGIGSLVAEFILDNKLNISLTRLGIRDENLYSYLERSKNQEMNNIDKNSIKKEVKKILKKKN